MGNFNSGKRTNRETTADMLRLDVRKLHRAGMLTTGTSGWRWQRVDGITLHEASIARQPGGIRITHGAGMSYLIGIERTACNMGGHRVWWLCPAVGCGRRVAILYGRGGAIFACRHCHRLNYPCQRESNSDRNFRQVEKLRERLGWQRGIANGHQGKPHRMRWQTYWKLVQQHERLERAICGAIARRFSISGK